MGKRNRAGALESEGFSKPAFQSNVGKEMINSKVSELVNAKLDRRLHALKIVPELEFFIRKLNEQEFSALESDILRNGCLDPIRVWTYEDEKVIVDGHHRYEICHKHEKPFSLEELTFSSLEDVKEWMIVNQLGRRNVTKENKIYLTGLHYNMHVRSVGRYSDDDALSVEELVEIHKMSARNLVNNSNAAKMIDCLDTDLRTAFLAGETDYKKIHLLEAYKELGIKAHSDELIVFLNKVSRQKEAIEKPQEVKKTKKSLSYFESYQQKIQSTTKSAIKKLKLEEKEKMKAFLLDQLEVLNKNIEEERSKDHSTSRL